MQTTTISPFGVDVTKQISSNPAEYDSLAKKIGACHEAAVNYYNYHRYFSDVRDVVLHGQPEVKDSKTGAIIQPEIKGMDEVFGVERKSEPVLNKDKTPKLMQDGKTPVTAWVEKEGDYFKRVVAEKSITEADLKTFVQSIVDQIPWNPSVSEHVARGPGKLANVWMEQGKLYYKAVTTNADTLAALNSSIKALINKEFVPVTTPAEGVTQAVQDEKQAEVLGRLLKEFAEETAKQSMLTLPGATSAPTVAAATA